MSITLQSVEPPRPPGVRHGFTGRAGGVSVGPLASLNLALRGAETPSALRENWTRALTATGLDGDVERVAILDQVHGDEVVVVEDGAGPLSVVARADAALTCVPGVCVAVRVADCVPILLAAGEWVGAVHAGWRGVASGIAPAAVRRLAERAAVASADVVVAIGPRISAARYEVGREVVQAIAATGVPLDRFRTTGPRGRPHVDLGGAVAAQLEAVGVERIDLISACTATPGFFSHRHDGPQTGRQAALIARWR